MNAMLQWGKYMLKVGDVVIYRELDREDLHDGADMSIKALIKIRNVK